MNNTQRGILTLIRCAITNESLCLPDNFSLEDAFAFARKRHLIPLLYTGAVRCNISKQDPVMLKMLQHYLKYMMYSEKQMSALSRLLDAFDKAHIDYLPLKGSHMKSLYPKPELRIMGDADILIRVEQYEHIIPILTSLGFTHTADCAHHFGWHTDNLNLELHQCLIPSSYTQYYNYCGNGWKLAVPDCGYRYRFSTPEDEFIFLFSHFTKHYLVGGIGCRHLIDLWIFRYLHPEMNESYIISILDTLQLTEFYQNILQVICAWFEGGILDEKTSFISEFIFTSSNWGTSKTHALAASVKDVQTIEHPKFYRLHRLIWLLFPPAENLKLRYPFLRKHAYLVPLFYPVRILDTLVNRTKNVKRHISDLNYSTADKVESYEQSLEYVGLRFNHKSKN